MSALNDIGGNQMKPGDRVIWLYSKKHSFVIGWRVQRVPGIIEQVCRARIRIRVRMGESEKVVNVAPENVLFGEALDE